MTRREKFDDKEYRAAYAENFLDTYIATQLRVLREERELTQEQLAAVADMKQSRISTMEDANYSGWSVKTLKRLAKAFDLALVVRFETFGGILREVERFNREHLRRPSYSDDPFFREDGTKIQEDDAGSGAPTGSAGSAIGLSVGTARIIQFPRNHVAASVRYSIGDATSGVASYGR